MACRLALGARSVGLSPLGSVVNDSREMRSARDHVGEASTSSSSLRLARNMPDLTSVLSKTRWYTASLSSEAT
eukprot:3626309-Prymnesium_polylepis.1